MSQTASEGQSVVVSVPVRANPPVDSFEWYRLTPTPARLFELRVGEQLSNSLSQRGGVRLSPVPCARVLAAVGTSRASTPY